MVESEDPLEAVDLRLWQAPALLQNLTLLSGGESFNRPCPSVCGVYDQPAPICVLDEVDAPLDDSNVDRFCSLLEHIVTTGKPASFVVTHHRMTMSRMDRLFGVTMAERGVSQLVSVDL